METIHNARNGLQIGHSDAIPIRLILPTVWALVVLTISAVIAKLAIHFFVRVQDKAVRRILFVALLLGNANNLPLLLIRRYAPT